MQAVLELGVLLPQPPRGLGLQAYQHNSFLHIAVNTSLGEQGLEVKACNPCTQQEKTAGSLRVPISAQPRTYAEFKSSQIQRKILSQKPTNQKNH